MRKLRIRFSITCLKSHCLLVSSVKVSDSRAYSFHLQPIVWPDYLYSVLLGEAGEWKSGSFFGIQICPSGFPLESAIVYTLHPRGSVVTFAGQWVLLLVEMLNLPKWKASCRVGEEQGLNDLIRHLWGPPGIWSVSALEKLTILARGSWRLLIFVILTADCPRGPSLLYDSESPTLPLFFSHWDGQEAISKAF